MMRTIILAVLLTTSLATTAFAKNMYIPVAGRAPGSNGTFWRTDVLPQGEDGTNISGRMFHLGRRETLVLDDVLSVIAPHLTHAVGAIRIDQLHGRRDLRPRRRASVTRRSGAKRLPVTGTIRRRSHAGSVRGCTCVPPAAARARPSRRRARADQQDHAAVDRGARRGAEHPARDPHCGEVRSVRRRAGRGLPCAGARGLPASPRIERRIPDASGGSPP